LPDSENITRQIFENDTLICETFNLLSCSYTDTIISYMRPLPVAHAGSDTTICYNTSITLGANPSATGGSPPYNYSWQPEENVSDPLSENPTASPPENEQYILTVIDIYNCSDEDTIYVTVNPETIIDIPENFEICQGQSIQLGGNPTATGSLFPYIYNWIPSNNLNNFTFANPVAQPEETTAYKLIVSTYLCDDDTAFVTVIVNPAPEVIAGEDLMIGSGESIILEAEGALSYEWFPDLYLDDYQSQNPEASPFETITYIVTGTDEFGCANSDSLTITVNNEIFIPNLFTPNNDGNNDTFKVYGTGVKELFIQIYNREGSLVFESDDIEVIMQTGWAGTNNGRILREAAYIWIIRGNYQDETTIDYKRNRGTVYLVR